MQDKKDESLARWTTCPLTELASVTHLSSEEVGHAWFGLRARESVVHERVLIPDLDDRLWALVSNPNVPSHVLTEAIRRWPFNIKEVPSWDLHVLANPGLMQVIQEVFERLIDFERVSFDVAKEIVEERKLAMRRSQRATEVTQALQARHEFIA